MYLVHLSLNHKMHSHSVLKKICLMTYVKVERPLLSFFEGFTVHLQICYLEGPDLPDGVLVNVDNVGLLLLHEHLVQCLIFYLFIYLFIY